MTLCGLHSLLYTDTGNQHESSNADLKPVKPHTLAPLAQHTCQIPWLRNS